MEKICLDFEASLAFLRGEPGTIEKLKWYADREDICVTAFAMAHILEAVKKPEAANAFVNSVTVLPFDKKAVSILGRLLAEARERGQHIKIADHLVTASICIANDAFIFTKSPADYEGVKGLRKV
jgi:predicted nucleic acid-binding protein